MAMLAAGGSRRRELYEKVQNLQLSVRFAAAPYQPVDTVGNRDERKSRANDRSWSAMDATFPICGGTTLISPVEGREGGMIEHVASSCDTGRRQQEKNNPENPRHFFFLPDSVD
jgi:hypothetical protein